MFKVPFGQASVFDEPFVAGMINNDGQIKIAAIERTSRVRTVDPQLPNRHRSVTRLDCLNDSFQQAKRWMVGVIDTIERGGQWIGGLISAKLRMPIAAVR